MLKKNQRWAIPFNPAHMPFFYGWVILIGGATGVLMSVPGQTIGMSVFIEDLILQLHLTRNQLSFTYMAGTLASSFLLTWLGKLYDRYGIRTIMSFGLLAMSAVLFCFQHLFDISAAAFQCLPAVNPLFITLLLLFLGFFGLRLLGQGAINIMSRNMVMKWFDKKRGLANGLMSVIISFGFSSTPLLLSQFKKNNGWASTWSLLIIITLLFTVIQLVLFRDNPQQAGLLPDGKPDTASAPSQTTRQYTLDQARNTYSFRVFTAGLAMYAIIITAIIFHIESIFTHAGLPGTQGYTIFLPGAVIAILFQFGGGWLSDYIPLKLILILHLFSLMVTLTGLYLLGQNKAALWILIAGQGTASGTFDVLYTVTWSKFFGTTHLGAISGYSLTWLSIASAIGPFMFSALTLRHSLLPAILLFAVALFILIILSLRANQPDMRQPAEIPDSSG